MKRTCLFGIGFCVSALIAGCGAESTQPGEADDELGALEVTATEARVAGSFALGADSLRFAGEQVAADEFDVEIEINGMVLSALLDRASQVAEVDGFAEGGADTQIVDRDRALLAAFVRALAAETDTEGHGPAAVLYRVASSWSQTPDTVPLQRQVASSDNRAYVSLCGSFGGWVDATHDGNVCSAFHPNCTTTAQVGNRVSPTYTDTGSGWTTAVPNHAYYPFQTGDCYGNCGAGCPGGNQTLTIDCHDHDQCVRNGHFIASFYCNDEFASASDDEFFAPTCAGT